MREPKYIILRLPSPEDPTIQWTPLEEDSHTRVQWKGLLVWVGVWQGIMAYGALIYLLVTR